MARTRKTARKENEDKRLVPYKPKKTANPTTTTVKPTTAKPTTAKPTTAKKSTTA